MPDVGGGGGWVGGGGRGGRGGEDAIDQGDNNISSMPINHFQLFLFFSLQNGCYPPVCQVPQTHLLLETQVTTPQFV